MVLFSIVIPTLNEERWLPTLLRSIRAQTLRDYEIIVSDSGSKDKTVEIARRFGAKVVEGPRRGPGAGRNTGVKKARGRFLLFLDADVALPKNFLAYAAREIYLKNLDIAVTRVYPLEDNVGDFVIYSLASFFIWILQRIKPHGAGWCIICKKSLFLKAGGFREDISFSEDVDFIEKAAKISRFGVVMSTYVRMSNRRLDKEGRARLIYLYWKYAFPWSRKNLDRVGERYEFAGYGKQRQSG